MWSVATPKIRREDRIFNSAGRSREARLLGKDVHIALDGFAACTIRRMIPGHMFTIWKNLARVGLLVPLVTRNGQKMGLR